MYMLKAKKNTEQQDHSQEKRERLDQKEKLTVLTGVTVNIDDKEDGSGASGSDFKPEELPDGICISPKKMTKSNPYENDGNTAVREASFGDKGKFRYGTIILHILIAGSRSLEQQSYGGSPETQCGP
ncbi:hypothetical protein LSH36_486g01039 [Paralvinella palmiformis]|uniref:Uncharacterized protein n=1 Tax=Paralvinella palmiformis TaxID=53620 RepID=A0AAD9JA68_9ANNE|nr:hypothetical protein LSH36_486g01039 [Paralvinella palmiformis]